MIRLDRIALAFSLCCLLSIGITAQSEETCLAVGSGTFKNWEADKLQIRRIAGCLKRHPFTVGFFGYYSDDKFSEKKATKEIEEAIADLKLRFPPESNRILVKYLGVKSKADFYSQVLPENFPAPWERSTEHVQPEIALTITYGNLIVDDYREFSRFVVSLPSDSLIAELLEETKRAMERQKIKVHHPLYVYLQDPETKTILDPKMSIERYGLKNGAVLRFFYSVR